LKIQLLAFSFLITVNLPSFAKEYFCYVPGAGGGSAYALQKLPLDLKARNIEALSFFVGKTGTVQEKALRLQVQIQKHLSQDSDFECHFFAYSQGGIFVRYAMNHLLLEDPVDGTISFAKIAKSFTSASTPHLGTPLARLGKNFLGKQLEEGLAQMSEEEVAKFNDPSNKEFYSPAIEGMPSFSYRTFIRSSREAKSLPEKLGFEAIKSDAEKRKVNSSSDGVIPFGSQGFAKVLSDINVSHGFFSSGTDFKPSIVDVMEAHFRMLKGQTPMQKSYPAFFSELVAQTAL